MPNTNEFVDLVLLTYIYGATATSIISSIYLAFNKRFEPDIVAILAIFWFVTVPYFIFVVPILTIRRQKREKANRDHYAVDHLSKETLPEQILAHSLKKK